MKKRMVKKIMAFLMAGALVSTMSFGNGVFAKVRLDSKVRVSVHDPSIIKDGDMYYAFGSHVDAAKSADLKNWTQFTNGYTTPGNVLFGDLSENLAGSFAWAGEDDSDSKGGFSVWAPTVFYNENYINEDGSNGAYMMYYCTSSTYKRSAIGYAVSQDIEGPYTYVDTIMYSGFTAVDSYDSNSKINTYYETTHIDELIEAGIINDVNEKWFNSDGSYNTVYAPNAIDPELFYDTEGRLWMTYGSWSGGVYILEIDKTNGQIIYPGTDSNTNSVNFTDRYFGKRIALGYTQSGEGADVVYDAETGYYYMTVTYGSLTSDGGYNMRLFRSENPDGPYVDAAGRNAALSGNVSNTDYGIKLISNYKFDCHDKALKAAGHNSVLVDDNGERYLIHHQRFDDGSEYHEVRVHQMFVNQEGWYVVAPYENNGDKISETGYSMEEIVGEYQFINHGTANTSAVASTLNVALNEDFTVSGDVDGTWTMDNGSYYMTITVNGQAFSGVFFKQQDESLEENIVMTFSAIGNNNESVWGSKLDLDDEGAVDYAGRDLEKVIPTVVKNNIDLPVIGAYGTSISWVSSHEEVLSSIGKIKRSEEDIDIVLTATITKGGVSETKDFTITVKGLIKEVGEEPIYKYEFEDVNENEVSNTGSKEGVATLMGESTVVEDEERGNVLYILNEVDARKGNYLSLPEDTFDGITSDGYTVSMWVNVDKEHSGYFEHSALFEANMTNGVGAPDYPITRLSANLFGRINSNGAWGDATEVSKSLLSNMWQQVTYTVNDKGVIVYLDGDEVSRQNKDLTKCFEDNFLALMNDVRVGSGNIWNDKDISKAMFDNVAVYDVALTDKQVEALYNCEIKEDDNTGGEGETPNPGEDEDTKPEDDKKPSEELKPEEDKKDETVVTKPNDNSNLPQTGSMAAILVLCMGTATIGAGAYNLKRKK